ncbi:hypothetical protein KKD70_04675 [Patescibacteria group bacterium]|nr:hypothetical protein [Patescibacteria group bacterium]
MVIKSDNISEQMLINKIKSVKSLSNYEKKEWERIVSRLDVAERNRLFEYFDEMSEKEIKFEIKIISQNKTTDKYDEICEDVTRKFIEK